MSLLGTFFVGVGVAALAAAGGFLVARRFAGRRVKFLARRLAWQQHVAARGTREQLRALHRSVGVLYLDGLPFSGDRKVARLFDAGLRSAVRASWDQALAAWAEAQGSATGSELVALQLLGGACGLMRGGSAEAEGPVRAALKGAKTLGDEYGVATARFTLGVIAREGNRPGDARGHFEASARAFRELGDQQAEARSWIGLAESCERLGLPQRALELYRQALRLFESLDDKVGAAAQYGAIGRILAAQGELDQSRAAHEDGLHLARQVRDRPGEAERLAAIGEIHFAQRNHARAQDVLERALRIYSELNQVSDQARILLRLAQVHHEKGEADVAQEFFERALAVARNSGDRMLLARSLEGVALGCAASGAFDRAVSLLEQAVAVDEEAGNQPELCDHLASLGHVRAMRGEPRGSIEALDRALGLAHKIGDRAREVGAALRLAQARRWFGEHALAIETLSRWGPRPKERIEPMVRADLHFETGMSCLGIGQPGRAKAELALALELHAKIAGEHQQGLDLVGLGIAMTEAGESGSEERIERGLRLLRSAGAKADLVRVLASIGSTCRRRGDLGRARQRSLEALELARTSGDVLQEADCLLEVGRTHAAAKEYDAARRCFDQALRIFNRAGAESGARDAGQELAGLPVAGAGVQFIDGRG